MLYSVLDLFRSPRESAVLVQCAEAQGFHRYWIGEHHHAAQCANPLLLAAVALGLTERLRVGTGALGILARSPLAIAEDVGIIRTLFGDRIDVGIARGFVGAYQSGQREQLIDGRDERALRASFPQRVRDLDGLLAADATVPPALWLVGSSVATAQLAAALGVGLCTSLYHTGSIAELDAALSTYRETFRPHGGRREPHAILVQSGVCAASAAQAEAALRSFLQPPDSASAVLTPKPMGAWLFAGTGECCREAIAAAVARFQPDELMIHHLLPDSRELPDSLELEMQSLELLAAALGLAAPPAPSPPGPPASVAGG